MTPDFLRSNELEDRMDKAFDAESKRGGMDVGRYGVKSYTIPNASSPYGFETRAIQSYPDFEGVLPGGRQLITDAKVCSQASFSLSESNLKPAQRDHMLRRGKMGAISFITIHFNKRSLATKTVDAVTVAVPVSPKHPIWKEFLEGARKSITPETAMEIGVVIQWNTPPRCRYPRPDMRTAIMELAENHYLKWEIQ